MNEYEVESEDYKGYKIRIIQDVDALDPRDYDEGLMGTMLCFHKQYELGDKTDLKSDDFSSWNEVEDHLVKKEGAILIHPLYLYDHSGLRMKIGSFQGLLSQGHAEFDSGQVGFIYTTAQRIKDMYGIKRLTKKQLNRADKELYGEVSTYDDYLSGNVWGFVIEDENEEHVDSCWGFYGDTKEPMEEAKRIVDGLRERWVEKLTEKKVITIEKEG